MGKGGMRKSVEGSRDEYGLCLFCTVFSQSP